MTFESELAASREYQINVVVKIGAEYFSKRQVDTGLVIDAEKVGMVDAVTINPTVLDLTRVKTSINSSTVKILDNDFFTAFLGQNDNSLIRETLQIWIGLNLTTGSFPWADYVKVNDYEIKSVSKQGSIYTLSAVSQTNRMQTPLFNVKGFLSAGIDASVNTFTVQTDNDTFETANYLKIDDEFLQYTGKSFSSGITTFTGVTRGSLGSTATAHSSGSIVNQVTEIQANPIDILLQLILSLSGTSSYDVLHDGIGIPDTLVNVAKFEEIRDDFFSGDVFRLYLYNIESALTFIETEILQPNNLRFVDSSAGISIAILDQSIPGSTLPEINADNCGPQPGWNITEDRIINQITFNWAWSEGLQKFTRVTTFNDVESQTTFGIKAGSDLKFKGVQADLSGSAIISDRAGRFLARFSTPEVQISADNCFLETYINTPGDKILFSHPDVPQEGGGLGINTELEIISKAINFATGEVRFGLAYTSYYNIRRGLIAPAPLISTVTDQKTFTVPNASHYRAGFVLRLWDETAGAYTIDVENEVESVDNGTNTIIMKNNFTTTLTTNHRIKFADYDLASPEQRARYAFVGYNSGLFDDNAKTYQIMI